MGTHKHESISPTPNAPDESKINIFLSYPFKARHVISVLRQERQEVWKFMVYFGNNSELEASLGYIRHSQSNENKQTEATHCNEAISFKLCRFNCRDSKLQNFGD